MGAWSGDDWREFEPRDVPDQLCDELCECERCVTESNQALIEAIADAEWEI